jgi:hypothetical protein
LTGADVVLSRSSFTGYLDAIGRRLDSVEVRSTSNLESAGAYAYLYDLSDRDRLRAWSCDSYPVPAAPVDEGFARLGCYGTQSALGRSGRL